MAILQSCCCWNSVRKGSYASAIYTLLFFSFSSFVYSLYIVEEQAFLSGKRKQPVGESLLERGATSALATVIFNIIYLACALLLILASLLLLVGLRTKKRFLLIPWILLMPCDILIEMAHITYLIIAQTVTFEPIVGFIFTITFFIMCLHLYCLMCVVSRYQELSEGQRFGQEHLRTEVVFHVTPCHKPSALKKSKNKSRRLLSPSPANTSNQCTNISIANEGNQEINQNVQTKDFDSICFSPSVVAEVAGTTTTTLAKAKRINFSDTVLLASSTAEEITTIPMTTPAAPTTTTSTIAVATTTTTTTVPTTTTNFQIPIITFDSTSSKEEEEEEAPPHASVP